MVRDHFVHEEPIVQARIGTLEATHQERCPSMGAGGRGTSGRRSFQFKILRRQGSRGRKAARADQQSSSGGWRPRAPDMARLLLSTTLACSSNKSSTIDWGTKQHTDAPQKCAAGGSQLSTRSASLAPYSAAESVDLLANTSDEDNCALAALCAIGHLPLCRWPHGAPGMTVQHEHDEVAVDEGSALLTTGLAPGGTTLRRGASARSRAAALD